MMVEVLKTLAERIDPAHTALIVVDMQNDFCAEGGYVQMTKGGDMSGNGPLAKKIMGVVEQARASGTTVVWIQANYEPRYLSGQALLKRDERGINSVCCTGGSWGWDFFEVKPADGEIVIEKHSFSGFFGTELDRLLRFRGIKTLVFTGVATNVCVESTLRDGYFLGYYIVMAEDCCDSSARNLHDATIANVRAHFGDVRNAAEITKVWKAALPAAAAQ
jgi:ureidoacrylate peracid hydrolase